jgi:hypothetical protein
MKEQGYGDEVLLVAENLWKAKKAGQTNLVHNLV